MLIIIYLKFMNIYFESALVKFKSPYLCKIMQNKVSCLALWWRCVCRRYTLILYYYNIHRTDLTEHGNIIYVYTTWPIYIIYMYIVNTRKRVASPKTICKCIVIGLRERRIEIGLYSQTVCALTAPTAETANILYIIYLGISWNIY